jgi:hypothetical protein
MKKIFVLMLMVMVFTTGFSADFGLEMYSEWKSSYVSVYGERIYEDPIIQSQILAWMRPKNFVGIFGAVTHLTNPEAMNSNYGDELDYTLGLAAEIKKVQVLLFATYFDVIPLGKFPVYDQVWFCLELNREFNLTKHQTIKPAIRIEAPWGIKGYESSTGWRAYPSVEHNWSFYKNLSLRQKVGLCIDDGALYLGPATLLDYNVELDLRLTDWVALKLVDYRIITPITSVSMWDPRQTEKILSFGVKLKF